MCRLSIKRFKRNANGGKMIVKLNKIQEIWVKIN